MLNKRHYYLLSFPIFSIWKAIRLQNLFSHYNTFLTISSNHFNKFHHHWRQFLVIIKLTPKNNLTSVYKSYSSFVSHTIISLCDWEIFILHCNTGFLIDFEGLFSNEIKSCLSWTSRDLWLWDKWIHHVVLSWPRRYNPCTLNQTFVGISKCFVPVVAMYKTINW